MTSQYFPTRSSILDEDALVKRILSLYPLEKPVRCRFFRRSMSDVYIVEAQDAAYFLKVYRKDKNSKENIEAEIDFLNDLSDNQVSVAKPIINCCSSYLNELNTPEGTRYAVLFHAATGDEPKESNLEQSRDFGKLAGRIHNCADRLGKQYNRRHLDEKYLIKDPISYMEPYLHSRERDLDYLSKFGGDLITELRSLLSRETPEYGICHGDLHAGNARYIANGELTLFDFDSFGYGWRAIDIGVYLVSYDWMDLSRETKSKKERFWGAFLEGYNQQRTLSKSELTAVQLCLPIRHLELMGITIRYWSQNIGISWIDDDYFDRHISWFKKWANEYRE